MKPNLGKVEMSSTVAFFLFVTSLFTFPATSETSCDFPEESILPKKDPPWRSHLMASGSYGSEYFIKRNLMEIHYPNSDRRHVRWSCVIAHHGKLLVKRSDFLANSYYRCIKVHIRSKSIVQISWSREAKIFDLSLCSDSHLQVDPWPLVRDEFIENDYTPVPFSGGFNMKITDSETGENGCNLMHRPMRMEAECVGGDGVVFDFISDTCLPDVNMFVKQKTTSVAAWKDKNNYYVILRRNEDTDLWCLVMPIHRGKSAKAYLFSDLVCKYDKHSNGFTPKDTTDIKYFTLELEQRVFLSLCEDEYSKCSSVKCNNYVKQECMRSCNACNRTHHMSECNFPRRFRGSWFLKEPNAYRHITVSQSDVSIQDVGKFRCVNFPDSPPRKSKTFTTLSLYNNGCRPRYTCIKLHRLATSVAQYSLGQSYSWPSVKNNFGKVTCDPDRFVADHSPIDDLYRSHADSGKPIIAQNPSPASVSCNLSSVYTVKATPPAGYVCSGSMYRHCEDNTKMRLDFSSCGGLIPMTSDFRCLATFEGHYWEKIILMQDVNNGVDVRCLVLSQFYPNEGYIMVGSECDRNSFNFARSKIRRPLLSLKFAEEDTPCLSVPPTLPPTMPPATVKTTSKYSINSLAYGHTSLSYSNRTHADQGHHNRRNSSQRIISTSPDNDSVAQRKINEYDEVKEGSSSQSKTPFNSNTNNYRSSVVTIGMNEKHALVLTLLTYYVVVGYFS